MDDHIHAVILLLILPLTVLFILSKKDIWIAEFIVLIRSKIGKIILNISIRLLRAICMSIMVFVFAYLLSFPCNCGEGNNPFSQLWIPALSSGLITIFIQSKKVYLTSALIFTVVAIAMGIHFHILVLSPPECIYTGDPEYISNSCSKHAAAIQLWHTWLTGVYGIKIL
jgi:hypothetical protein